MKFKLVLIIFNVLIVGSFFLLFFIPVMILGWEFSRSLWTDAWYLPLIFLVLIVLLNLYFFMNRRYFALMEQEKWQEVLEYLDDEFYKKSRGKQGLFLNSQRIRVYINASLVSSQSYRLAELEEFLKKNQPKLFEEFFLSLGLPRLLKDEPAALESYYRQVYELKKPADRGWCIWLLAFSLLLQKRLEEVRGPLMEIASAKDPMLRLLVLYLLSVTRELNTGDGIQPEFPLDAEKEKLVSELTPNRFRELKEKEQGNLLFFALSDFMGQAFTWLRPDTAGETAASDNS